MTSKPLRYIDIGCNLLDPMYQGVYGGKQYHDPDLDTVLQRAWDAGVQKIVITAGNLEEAREALRLARTDDRLFCTVGVHPTRSNAFLEHPEGPEAYLACLLQVLREGVAEGKVVAVGEVGLDYDRLHFSDAETQRRFFALQFELVRQSGLPMFLHMRNAAQDFIRIFKENQACFCGGVVHCFTGSMEDAEQLLELHPKVHIGLTACSLKTEENCQVAAAIPVDRLMIETDGPWCDCRPTHASAAHVQSKLETKDKKKHSTSCLVKGRNEPCNIVQVLEAVAGCKELRNKYAVAETICRVTERCFFPVRE